MLEDQNATAWFRWSLSSSILVFVVPRVRVRLSFLGLALEKEEGFLEFHLKAKRRDETRD